MEYALDGAWTTLEGELAMRDGTPDGLAAEVTLLLDGAPLAAYRVDASDAGVPLKVLTEGADVLTVQAVAVEGECATDPLPYLVFADTYVAP
ncbi:hypothetical protein C8046_10830 [Serinibacter arcticus]|uniref:Glycosyl hydrolase family 98 putative carbohydrate-binding module domain-containing protein n=1 Tax=Serinibacter arcticus TaxID=1655435 RepID=A0A2U1ZVQ3_9MICO|nr:hypothetical protein [Serinibacter arcticus]PWD51066.1 hypothetical protein C8046_10830 [Serinibacter arcticus]